VTQQQTSDGMAHSKVKAVFNQFDLDGDGVITIKELTEGLKRMNIASTPEEVYMFMREVDLDGDGKIDFNEFTIYYVGKQQQKLKQQTATDCLFGKEGGKCPSVTELRTRFAELDADGNGFITLDELKAALINKKGSCTDEEVYKLMREADEDGDGKISFD
uniref:Calmodulin-like n=1 Tax=Saccoglossus kowalevskii TaxID=10224 RepID=A0ABM0MCX6_SACKO